MLARQIEPFLENLALAGACTPESVWGDARRPMEGTDKIRQIVEPYVEGDMGNGALILDEQAGRMTQP